MEMNVLLQPELQNSLKENMFLKCAQLLIIQWLHVTHLHNNPPSHLLASSVGDEGSSGPVSPPRPTQLPPCPPLLDAPVLAGRSRRQANV